MAKRRATLTPSSTARREDRFDQQQFDQCVDREAQAKIQAHEELAMQQHIAATPSFIIGGKIVEGPRPYDEFKAIVDSALARSGSPVAVPADSGAKKTGRAAKGQRPAEIE
jgi:hypothetical protein